MDDVKRTYRESEKATKDSWRNADGESPADAEKCHLVFIGAAERNNLSQILTHLKTASVLTVGDTEAFTRQGGIINFALDKKHRFEINRTAERLAKLETGSQLLEMGKVVSDEKTR